LKWVPCESAPRFQLGANAFFISDNCDQVAGAAESQHSNQLRQKARCKSLSPDIQFDVSPHRNTRISEVPVTNLLRCDLLRRHPFIRASQLDGNVRNEDVQRLAIGGTEMLG
jgi:hypothetical protein